MEVNPCSIVCLLLPLGILNFFLSLVDSVIIVPSYSTTINVTVAKDGSGNFRTISEAVLEAPTNASSTYFINIKPGVYEEYVFIPEDKPFLALIGSGADKTKILGNRSSKNGFKITESATLIVNGAHFLLQHITIENSYGAGTQAVALYCHADYAIFYKCSIKGYQDTLFADKSTTRQFYRECDIYGTVDFLFGDAVAVFQNCNLFARHTGAVFTANSRDRLNSSSAYVLHNCSLKASPEIAAQRMNAYLGRSWRNLSRVIVMECFLDDIIDPSGWELMGKSTGEDVTYREYHNRGGGASVTGRVKWHGYKAVWHHQEVMQYTARNLIGGDTWIPQTGVPYYGGLAMTRWIN